MQSYRLMLVDDEEELRQGIIRRVDWEAIGFTVVGEAENGQMGVELAANVHPDVVVTDIKMPFMDGLEMTRRILENASDTRFIVLSGFDDFEYAQTAITLGAIEYILKPISAEELIAVLQRLHIKMDAALEEKHNIERLREHYIRSLPLLRDQFLTALLQRRTEPAQLREQGVQYGVNLDAPYFAVARIHCDRGQASDSVLMPQPELIPVSLLEQATESLRDRCDCEIFLYDEDVAVVARLQTPALRALLMDTLDNLCKSTRRFLQLHTTVGIGSVVDSCGDIFASARGAQRALEYRGTLGMGRAILIDDIEPNSAWETVYDENEQQQLIAAIKLGTQDDVEERLLSLASRCAEQKVSQGTICFYTMQIVTELTKLIQVYHLASDTAQGNDYVSLMRADIAPELLWRGLISYCQNVNRLIYNGRSDSVKSLAERSRQYIDSHYTQCDLSVERLCEQFFVSQSYFSTVFKRENGESFTNYLTNLRMEKAAELLEKTTDKTYVVAGQVGFAESNYFSYVFKKHFGMSPSKYRQALTQ